MCSWVFKCVLNWYPFYSRVFKLCKVALCGLKCVFPGGTPCILIAVLCSRVLKSVGGCLKVA